MSGIGTAKTLEDAVLGATGKEEHRQGLLGHYFVSEDDLRKLEEGVDFAEMQRFIAFLLEGLKRRPSNPQRLELNLDEDFAPPAVGTETAALPTAAKKDMAIAKEAVAPIEIDWDEFSGLDHRNSDVRGIVQTVRTVTDDAVTPVMNLAIIGQEITPNIHMEVVDQFTLQQRLLYKDLPHETFLLLSVGADLEKLLRAAQTFKTDHPQLSHETFVALCANIYRGYGVRFYWQLMNDGEMMLDDDLDLVVRADMDKAGKLIKAGTMTAAELEAHLAGLFLLNEKKHEPNMVADELYDKFIHSDVLSKG